MRTDVIHRDLPNSASPPHSLQPSPAPAWHIPTPNLHTQVPQCAGQLIPATSLGGHSVCVCVCVCVFVFLRVPYKKPKGKPALRLSPLLKHARTPRFAPFGPSPAHRWNLKTNQNPHRVVVRRSRGKGREPALLHLANHTTCSVSPCGLKGKGKGDKNTLGSSLLGERKHLGHSREVRIRVPFLFSVVYTSRGTQGSTLFLVWRRARCGSHVQRQGSNPPIQTAIHGIPDC